MYPGRAYFFVLSFLRLFSAPAWRRPLVLGFACAALVVTSSCRSKEESADDQIVSAKTVRELTPAEQVRELTASIERDPQNAALYGRRARLYLQMGNGPLAVPDAEQLLKLDGPKAANYLLRAQALRAVGKVKEALADCTQAEQMGYDGPELPLLQGEIFYILRKYQESIDYLNRALQKSQFEEKAYYYKGMVYAETGDTLRAISSLQTAVEQSPQFADAINQLAAIYNAKKDYATARTYLLSGMRARPDDGFLYFNLGNNILLQNLPDSALKMFTKATQIDSSLYLAHYNAAVLHYKRDEFADVVRHLRAVLRHTDKLPSTRLLLADSYDRLGQYRAAIRQYQTLVQADPADTRVARRLQVAQALQRQQLADSVAGRRTGARTDSLRKVM